MITCAGLLLGELAGESHEKGQPLIARSEATMTPIASSAAVVRDLRHDCLLPETRRTLTIPLLAHDDVSNDREQGHPDRDRQQRYENLGYRDGTLYAPFA
jgi:hypothetical protein